MWARFIEVSRGSAPAQSLSCLCDALVSPYPGLGTGTGPAPYFAKLLHLTPAGTDVEVAVWLLLHLLVAVDTCDMSVRHVPCAPPCSSGVEVAVMDAM